MALLWLMTAAVGCCCPATDSAPGRQITIPSTAPGATSTSSPAAQTHTDAATGISFLIPPDWMRLPPGDVTLRLSPFGGRSWPQITLDIPNLPPHVPGWIPIGMVRNGYVDDVASAHPGARSVDLDPPDVKGAKVRLVRSEWVEDVPITELALLLVRGDRVYLVVLRGLSSEHASDRLAFDLLRSTLTWTK